MVKTQFLKAPPAESPLKQVSGPATNGLIQMLRQRRDVIGQARANEQTYGSIHVLNMFGSRWVAAGGASAAEQILMNKDKAFANGPGWSPLIGGFFQRGLMLLDFDEHRDHRSVMQQAFTPTALESYMHGLQSKIAQHVDALPLGSVEAGNPVYIYTHLKSMTLEIALEVFLGARLDPREGKRISSAFVDCLRASGALFRHPVPGTRWSKGLRGRQTLQTFIATRISSARAHPSNDLLSMLCHAQSKNGRTFSDQEIIDHMIFLLMAAHDTTTTTLANMIYYLAKSPNWQRAARERSVGLGDTLEYADLAQLREVEWIFKESARLCPPTPLEPRMAVKDTEVSGYYIPKGTLVFVPTNVNHRRADIWPQPDVFDPSRFSEERSEQKVHRLAWAPFGAGVHKCIGIYFAQIEIKLVMHRLLRRFEWSVPANYSMRIDISTLPSPHDGLPVTIKRIQKLQERSLADRPKR